MLALALVVALAPGTAAADTSDALITMRCKIALFVTDNVSSGAINVDTAGGNVTLHGKVGSGAERERAEAVVRTVEGVREVRNLLQVVPADRKSAVKESDAEIKKRIEKAFESEQSLADSDISVESVHDGVVLLGGKATGLVDRMRALEIATLVPGVRRVSDAIEYLAPDGR